MQKIIWTLILILIGLGFFPYKYTRDINSLSDKELLVSHYESTCVSDFTIVKGKLDIPENLKPLFTEPVFELTITTENNPLKQIDSNEPSWELIDNDFIISGKVVGVDSIYKKHCGNYAFYQIDNWAPTKYKPNLWTFKRPVLILYFLTLIILILSSISIFIRRLLKTRS